MAGWNYELERPYGVKECNQMADDLIRKQEQPLPPAMRMTVDVPAARPVFIHRSSIGFWFPFGVSVYILVTQRNELSWAQHLLTLVLMYIVTDFYSGVLHVVLDLEEAMYIPIIWRSAYEFQWHHHLPMGISSKPLSTVLADAVGAYAMHPLLIFVMVYFIGFQSSEYHAVAMAWKLIFGLGAMLSHRTSHFPTDERHPLANLLVRAGLLLDPKQHRIHHYGDVKTKTPAYTTRFCILNGWCNPVLDRLCVTFDASKHSYTWIAMWLLLTAFDGLLIGNLIEKLPF